ncbi:MAG: AmmeMemoRadiSam system radical SAM enzyme [archaeon]
MKFFQKEIGTKSTIKCTACKHYCIIPENGFGLCGVRKNVKGIIDLVTHSSPCSLHLDPIEKKPLYHFLPHTNTMSIGFFGCNFRCDFCQNCEISFTRGTSAEIESKKIKKVSPNQFVSLAKQNKAKSIAITYNEPAISVEYNLEAIQIAHKNKLKSVYVSNGYVSEEQIVQLNKPKTKLDAINIDLKSFNSGFYQKTCGGQLEGVLDSIKSFHKAGTWVELTTLLIPGKNDSSEELKQIAKFVYDLDKNIPWHVSAFFPYHKMTNVPPTTDKEIVVATKIGKENGLNFVYGGNLNNTELSSTFCPKCGNLLIKRIGFESEIIGLEKDKCIKCGEKIKGVFE